MSAISVSQQRILNRMRNGAKLSLEHGKYKLAEGSIVRTVNSKTVEVLKAQCLIEGAITGQYRLASSSI